MVVLSFPTCDRQCPRLRERQIAGRHVILEVHTGQAPDKGILHQIAELAHGLLYGQTRGAHVGDAVASLVGQAGRGRVGHVDAQGIGRAEAGAFAHQHDHQPRVEQGRHIVAHSHAAELHQSHRRGT